MTRTVGRATPLQWAACIAGALVFLAIELGAGVFLLFLATPACNEPRNNVTVALVRAALAVVGAGYGAAGFAVGRNVLRVGGTAKIAWYALLVPGTLLPLIAAAAFRAPAIGDLFCF